MYVFAKCKKAWKKNISFDAIAHALEYEPVCVCSIGFAIRDLVQR